MSSDVTSVAMKMIVPAIIEQYTKECSVTWETALERLYNSTLYKTLEDSESALHNISPSLLSDLLIEEYETGSISWPEEQ